MSLKEQIVKGTFWTVFGQIGYMAVSLITNIIMARLLTPYEFGQLGILMFFILIANIFTESGFGGALVRKLEVTREDYSTVFVFNLVISTICYILLLVFSSKIANYYDDPALKKLLMVMGSLLFINAFNITQNARLIRDLNFKKKSLVLLFANIISAIISIIMAYRNYGVWALVTFQLLTAALNTIFLFIADRIFFSIRFSISSFKELFSFGANTTLTSLISTAFDNIYQLILGRFFSINQVGFYYQAKKLQLIPFTILNSVIQGVLFSSLAKLQNDTERFVSTYNKLLLMLAIIMAAISSSIFLYSESIVLILFGAKWHGAIFYMQLLVIASFFYFQELVNNIIFKVFNKTKQILYLEIIKKIIQILSILAGVVLRNIQVLLIGFIISSVISYSINFYFSRKVLGSRSLFEVYSLIKIVFISIASVVISKSVITFFNLDYLSSLMVLPLFILSMVFLSKWFNLMDIPKELRHVTSLFIKK